MDEAEIDGNSRVKNRKGGRKRGKEKQKAAGHPPVSDIEETGNSKAVMYALILVAFLSLLVVSTLIKS